MTQFKLSRYLIATDPIVNGKFRLVYSSSAARLTLIKEQIWQALKVGKLHHEDENLLGQLQTLRIIVPDSTDELTELLQENRKQIAESDLLYQVVQPSANCQLGCGYCGQVHEKRSMGGDLVDSVFNRVAGNLARKPYRHLRMGWFGGEPLLGLARIRLLSDRLMTLAEQSGVQYSAQMVTNGLGLKPNVFFQLAQTCKVVFFEVTLDGSRDYHDARRHTKTSERTFDIIFRNIRAIVHDPRFKDCGATLSIRCNIDRSNANGAEELIDLLHRDGILDKIQFYSAPIHSWGNDAHLGSLSKEDFAALQIRQFLHLRGTGNLPSLLPGRRKHSVCMATDEDSELFDAYGNVFNCTEVAQVPAYQSNLALKLGKLHQESPPIRTGTERPFSDWNDDIGNREVPCWSCPILPVCGGQCPKLWKEQICPCPPIKFNIKERMLLSFVHDKEAFLSEAENAGAVVKAPSPPAGPMTAASELVECN